MAPSWVFVIMILISALMGMGQATSTIRCGDDKKSQCVKPDLCNPMKAVKTRMIQCPGNDVCCRVEEINNLDGYEFDEFN